MMSERIKQLAEQATTITYEEDGWRLYGTKVETFNKEKFAELIVLECSSICYKSFENGDEIAGLLMQTFGVEE